MAASDNFLCDALRTLGAKPSDSALRTAKQKYSQQVSEKVALAIAAEFRQRGLDGTRPALPGEIDLSGAERRMAGGIGAKRVDVTWATEESGLLLAISVKSINFRDQRSRNFQKNLTNRRGDMLFESVTLHRRFPYAVLGGLLLLDKNAEHDATQKRRSTFLNAHDRLRLFTGRSDPAGRDEQYEQLYIALMDATPFAATVRIFLAGDPETEVPIVRSLHELGARICVVGDDDQTIYQWRGSDVDNILTFAQRYPTVDQIPIEENFRSSDGIVETARPFIEQNAARLQMAMKGTGLQPYETGDIIGLSFGTPFAEAQHIAATAQSLRGIAFVEDGKERGLSWSDMAVLLRSVKANAEPITATLRASGIPFVVTGMMNLFGTAEAEAARQLFYFIGDNGVDEAGVEQAWSNAGVGLEADALNAAVEGAAAAKAALTDPDQKRWGQYSIQRVFLNFLERAGLREELVPDGRGEVVFYNLGKFSQVISDFEAIHFQSKPSEKYGAFANFLQYRAEDAYPEGWQDNQYTN